MRALVLIVAVIVGCGAELRPLPFAPDDTLPCGLLVHTDTTRGPVADWVRSPAADSETCLVARRVEDYVGVPRGTTAGVVVSWTGPMFSRNGFVVFGIYHDTRTGWKDRWIELPTYDPDLLDSMGNAWQLPSPDSTALAHELLHDLIWDPDHTSSLWYIIYDVGRGAITR
jgi:hypothetical protein